ncbi:MAG: hypothetical protein Q9166_006734 [cf. Caloplaca sp. 2 TL-2023]
MVTRSVPSPAQVAASPNLQATTSPNHGIESPLGWDNLEMPELLSHFDAAFSTPMGAPTLGDFTYQISEEAARQNTILCVGTSPPPVISDTTYCIAFRDQAWQAAQTLCDMSGTEHLCHQSFENGLPAPGPPAIAMSDDFAMNYGYGDHLAAPVHDGYGNGFFVGDDNGSGLIAPDLMSYDIQLTDHHPLNHPTINNQLVNNRPTVDHSHRSNLAPPVFNEYSNGFFVNNGYRNDLTTPVYSDYDHQPMVNHGYGNSIAAPVHNVHGSQLPSPGYWSYRAAPVYPGYENHSGVYYGCGYVSGTAAPALMDQDNHLAINNVASQNAAGAVDYGYGDHLTLNHGYGQGLPAPTHIGLGNYFTTPNHSMTSTPVSHLDLDYDQEQLHLLHSTDSPALQSGDISDNYNTPVSSIEGPIIRGVKSCPQLRRLQNSGNISPSEALLPMAAVESRSVTSSPFQHGESSIRESYSKKRALENSPNTGIPKPRQTKRLCALVPKVSSPASTINSNLSSFASSGVSSPYQTASAAEMPTQPLSPLNLPNIDAVNAKHLDTVDPWDWTAADIVFALTNSKSLEMKPDPSLFQLTLPPTTNDTIASIFTHYSISGRHLLTTLSPFALNHLGIPPTHHSILLNYITLLRKLSPGFKAHCQKFGLNEDGVGALGEKHWRVMIERMEREGSVGGGEGGSKGERWFFVRGRGIVCRIREGGLLEWEVLGDREGDGDTYGKENGEEM